MVVSSCRYGITLDAMTCLSRRDPNKDIFKKVKKSHIINKRWNFYKMVDINLKKMMLECQKESYPISDDLCKDDDKRRPCTLKNTNNEVVDLNTFSNSNGVELCFDYSFWEKSTITCSSTFENDPYKIMRSTHAFLCNRNIDCSKSRSNYYGYCPNSSTRDVCNAKDHYFCEKSATCIPWGEKSSIFMFSKAFLFSL